MTTPAKQKLQEILDNLSSKEEISQKEIKKTLDNLFSQYNLLQKLNPMSQYKWVNIYISYFKGAISLYYTLWTIVQDSPSNILYQGLIQATLANYEVSNDMLFLHMINQLYQEDLEKNSINHDTI